MVMAVIAYLDELDSSPKVIHYLLIPTSIPPFDGKVVLAAGSEDPKRNFLSGQFPDLRVPGLLQSGNVDVAFKYRRLDMQTKTLVQKFSEAVKAVIGDLVTSVDQGVRAVQD